MSTTLNIAGIVEESVVDGPGIRFVVFVQGCPRSCPGCHNPETQPLTGGYKASIEDLQKQIDDNPLLSGVTFSGGEPFLQARGLSELAKWCHERGLSVIVYTGYRYEELVRAGDPDWNALLSQADYLIDGPFVQDLMSLSLKFRGSKNQRIINLKETRTNGKLYVLNV